MPRISLYECDLCPFKLPSGWGGYMYVIDDDGQRQVCPHPGEYFTVARVLGADATEEMIDQRTGFNSHCVCLECLARFHLDLRRDPRECPECSAARVASARELVGKECPNCGAGHIREIDTGIIS